MYEKSKDYDMQHKKISAIESICIINKKTFRIRSIYVGKQRFEILIAGVISLKLNS